MIHNRGRAAIAVAMMFAFTACGGDAGEQDPAPDTPADQPATPPAAPPTMGANVELPAGVTQEMVAQGQQQFNQLICTTCHGVNAVGSPLGPPLNDATWLNADGTYESILQVIHTGVTSPVEYPTPMPAMGGAQLTEEQMRQLAAYIFSISRGG